MLENNIKFFRELREISQKELASKSRLSKSYISELERYRKNPTLKTLKRIADALEVCTGVLVADNKYCTCIKNQKCYKQKP